MKVPEVGESITEVTISGWVKNDGDYVELDEVLCELESDKATFELPAEQAGILRIKAEEGETLEIGSVICEIEEGEKSDGKDSKAEEKDKEDEEEKPAEKSTKSDSSGGVKKTGSVKEMVVPEVGESITEVTISNWLKSRGDYVELDEVIAEVESDKATFELPAEATGYIEIIAEEGDTLEIGGLICKIEETEGTPEGEASETPEKEDTASSKKEESSDTYASGHPSPAAAKILEEKGISPEDVKGTGRDGRITKEDAEKAEKQAKQEEKSKKTDDGPPAQQPVGERNQSRKKLSSLRKTIAKRLVSVKNETAMLTTFNEVNMQPIMDIRSKYKEAFKEKHEVGLGFMSFFTKAVCQALEEWPAVNAMIDEDEVVYNHYSDISIAVSTPKGLVVPVIRNAENLDFKSIEKEIIRLATKARDGKLSIDEMTGGTFTITNGGIFGSMLSTPIINSPQSAILGMHNIVQRPVVENGEIVVRPIMYVALSYDHRIVDGRESVSFLVRVKELLEDPARLLIGI